MFSKDIVRSDAFLDLPISSQALYFHLGMEADDRGYVSNPKMIIRTIGATLGDLEQLANKRFILIRENGLILIKHWKINNLIKTDRFVETKFTDDLKKLFFDENNSYTEKATNKPCLESVEPKRNPNGTQMEPQDSIGKYRIDKDSKERYTVINNDEPQFCESCFMKLITKKFLSLEDYAEKDRYLELFNLLQKTYTKKNICISLNYTIARVCKREWNPDTKRLEYSGINDDLSIEDKYSYLRTALYNSCERFKDGYEEYLDVTSASYDNNLKLAALQYECQDSKLEEFTE